MRVLHLAKIMELAQFEDVHLVMPLSLFKSLLPWANMELAHFENVLQVFYLAVNNIITDRCKTFFI